MSISSTLANALSGLAAQSRAAQVVSSNVSNATTEGFARREIHMSARQVGGLGAGVQVDGVIRIVDENVLRERRLAAASLGAAQTATDFHSDFMNSLGQPDNPGSLAGRVVALETSLLEAASRPDSDARLTNVLYAASALAEKLNTVSDDIQKFREYADRSLAEEVNRLNASLEQVAELNAQILRARGSNRDYPALLDSRQKLIDDISELVPLRQLQRENDTVALYSLSGALLLDVEPARFEFTATSPIMPDMTQSSGALSGLTLNEQAVTTAGSTSPINGGRLESLFAVRDSLAPAAQANVDAVAADMIARFEDPTLDLTLASGDPGVFTDRGAALDSANLVGLAGRISVNAVIDPSEGGDLWRLRDGLGSLAAGPPGDASLLTALSERMQVGRSPLTGTMTATDRTVSGFVADLTSVAGQVLQIETETLSFERARYLGLEDAMLSNGVDTDQEMQKLLLIEQAYAANARVIQTADELIQLLIGL